MSVSFCHPKSNKLLGTSLSSLRYPTVLFYLKKDDKNRKTTLSETQTHNLSNKKSNARPLDPPKVRQLPHDVEDDDALDVGQVDDLAIDLKLEILPQVLGESAADHLLQRDLDVDGLVVKPGVELVRLVFALGVERVAQVGVQPDAEVVVHDENLSWRKKHVGQNAN